MITCKISIYSKVLRTSENSEIRKRTKNVLPNNTINKLLQLYNIYVTTLPPTQSHSSRDVRQIPTLQNRDEGERVCPGFSETVRQHRLCTDPLQCSYLPLRQVLLNQG